MTGKVRMRMSKQYREGSASYFGCKAIEPDFNDVTAVEVGDKFIIIRRVGGMHVYPASAVLYIETEGV